MDKTAGPFRLVSEIVKSVGEAGISTEPNLINQILVEGVIQADWELITTTICYKDNRDTVESNR